MNEIEGYKSLARKITLSAVNDLKKLLSSKHNNLPKMKAIASNYFFFRDGLFKHIIWYDTTYLDFLSRYFNEKELNEMKKISEFFELKKDNLKNGYIFQRLNTRLLYLKIDSYAVLVKRDSKQSFKCFVNENKDKIFACFHRDGSVKLVYYDTMQHLIDDVKPLKWNYKLPRANKKLREDMNDKDFLHGGTFICIEDDGYERYYVRVGGKIFEIYMDNVTRVKMKDIEDDVSAMWNCNGKLIWSNYFEE